MGTMRVESARFGTLTARVSTGSWNRFDLQMAFYALALAVVGLLMAYTNSAGAPLEAGSVFTRGLMWLAIALVVFTVATAIDYRWLADFAWPLYALNLFLLALTLVIGTGLAGVSRWINIFGMQFQFSELAKVLMAIVLANYLAGRQGRLKSPVTIIGAALLAAPPLALVLIQPDLGTSLVFGAIVFGTLFLSGASLRWLLASAIVVASLLPVIWFFVLKDYQQQRLISFLNPSADPLGSGYQILQSEIAGRAARQGAHQRDADAVGLPARLVDRLRRGHARGGARVHRLRRGAASLRGAALAGVADRLAGSGSVRAGVLRRGGLDDRLPAAGQFRDGARDDAHHRHPVAFHHPWRGVADQHRPRSWHPSEHRHAPGQTDVVTRVLL